MHANVRECADISASLRRASCLTMSSPAPFLSLYFIFLLSPSRFRGRSGFLMLLAPSSLRPSRSLTLSLPGSRADLPSPLSSPSSASLGARSIHGIASWCSRKAVDCRQLRQTAHRSHTYSLSLSLIAYSPTGSPTGLPRSSALSILPSPLSSPLLHTLCLVARPESQPATRDPPVTQQ